MIISRKEAREKGMSLFFTGRACKNGHIEKRRVSNSNCLLCEKKQNHDYYYENIEYHKERSRRWREENPDKIAQQRERASIRRASLSSQKPKRIKTCPKELDRRRYIRDKEKRLAQGKEYYERNKDRIKIYKAKWHAENQEKVRASRWRRKSLKKQADGWFTGKDIERLFQAQKGKCIECKICIKGGYDIDHIMPLYLGGSNYPSNLQLLCSKCNRKKSYKDPIEWANENGRLL